MTVVGLKREIRISSARAVAANNTRVCREIHGVSGDRSSAEPEAHSNAVQL